MCLNIFKEKYRIMSNHFVVPDWNVKQQEQPLKAEDGRDNTTTSLHQHSHRSHLQPMSNYEVAELTWENGQLAMHGLLPPTKPTWVRSNGTLESIVHQAAFHDHQLPPPNIIPSMVASSGTARYEESSGQVPVVTKKRTRSESGTCLRKNFEEDDGRLMQCASASGTFGRDDHDTTMMTWASYESPRSLKMKVTDDDSACHDGSGNQDEDRETREVTGRSSLSRRNIRAAATHNESERRRRDRINQKMKTLQKLVPNASKTDKASMLDEVIDYLKQLQAQVQMMSMRSMPQMMMQQQLHMSMLARMGMAAAAGVGLAMDINPMVTAGTPFPHPAAALPSLLHPPHVAAAVASAAPTFLPPTPFAMPTAPLLRPVDQPNINQDANNNASSVPIMAAPYSSFLAQQSMNMEMYNKMAAMYRQQMNQTTQRTGCPAQSSRVQGSDN